MVVARGRCDPSSLGDIDAIKAQHYWVQDYVAETRFSNVTKAIHVQAALGSTDPVEETKWLQAFADRFGFPHGIVAECHLAQSDAEAELARHVEFANVRGIRELVPAEMLADPNWIRGFKLLPRFNLVPCLSTTHEHLPKVSRLAGQVADHPVCIEHCAFPMERSKEYFAGWRRAVASWPSRRTFTSKSPDSGCSIGHGRSTASGRGCWNVSRLSAPDE